VEATLRLALLIMNFHLLLLIRELRLRLTDRVVHHLCRYEYPFPVLLLPFVFRLIPDRIRRVFQWIQNFMVLPVSDEKSIADEIRGFRVDLHADALDFSQELL